jgi:hypothetical protein
LSVPFPKPIITKPAIAAKMIGKNLIIVTIQFCKLAAFVDKPVIQINQVEIPKEIRINQYHSMEKPNVSCTVITR